MHAYLRRPVSRAKPFLPLLLAPLTLLQWSNAHAINVNSDCAAAYGNNFVPVTGQVTASTPNLPRPIKGVLQKDPNFGTCVIRATDAAVEPPTTFARNDYSRRQAFNVDNSRFIVYASGGAWHMYDANTLAYIRELSGPAGDAEPQWDATDPKSLYYVPTNGGMTLYKLNVETNVSTVAADFRSRLPWGTAARVWTHSEGSPSANSRYWCFLAETSSFGMLGVFTYDLQTNTILGTRSYNNQPDYVSMTPSGRSCVVAHDWQSTGTVAWNTTFTASKVLNTTSEHSDLAIGANGDDYYVFVDFQSNNGDLVMVDVDTGVRTTLFASYVDGTTTSYHLSGKGFSRPGWFLLDTYNHSGATEKWLHERMMAVELKANPKIINLAHHHSSATGYWSQPHASISRDFTRALFTSNWGSTSDTDVDAYMLRLSDNTFGAATTPTPTTDITAPTVTASETGSSGTVTLTASANDNVGVSTVDFMVDGVLKGSDSTSPYSMTLASSTLTNGSHSHVAVAYDAAANAGTSAAFGFSINNTVADTNAPSVTAAESGTSGTITLSATASDNVGVSRVEFWIDGVLKGSDTTSPYALTLNSTTLSNGSHSLVAKAFDAAGNVGSSTGVSFSISNTTTSTTDTTAPTTTAVESGTSGTITLSATASDNVAVSRVEFWVDGVRKSSDSSSPYRRSLDSTKLSNGSHSLVAKALDAAGNVGSSAGVGFSISNGTSTTDTTAPSVTAAESGTRGTITLSATASDNVGVTRVEFWVDNVLKGSDTASPYALSLNSTTLANGSHSLVAKAYDAAGNVRSSTAASFSISNTTTTSTIDTTAPSVTGAIAVAIGSITMSASASDNVGVTRVDFWIDGVAKGSDSTSPYSLAWNTSSWWPGSSHSLVAKAYDAAGNVTASSPVSFSVK